MFRTSLSLLILCFSFFCFINFNCTKIDNTTIGADLLPAVDNVNTFDLTVYPVANNFDTASKECFVVRPEDEHSLGYISNNPLFGTTASSIYVELQPESYPFSFPANTTLDSIVLVLSYKSAYGDTTVSQKVSVFQIADKFIPDTSSCRFYNYLPAVLGSAVYTPQRLKDSVTGFKERSANELRIKLDDIAFGRSLLSQDTSTGFKSDSLFKIFFKGFAIVPDVSSGGNALSYFNLADTNTKLAIYVKSVNTTTDTSVYNFRLTPFSYSANYVVRNHTGAEISNHLAQPPQGDDVIYIQTTPGTYATIKIPALDTLSNKIIHRAVLMMDQVYSDDPLQNIFLTPNVLYLDLKDTSVTYPYKPIPCDFTNTAGSPNISTFGGFRTTAKDQLGHNISRYTFNISRYVQKIITNKRTNSTLRLRAPDNIINLNGYFDDCLQGVSPFIYPVNLPTLGQVKLGGGNNPDYKMKLYIVYSNI